MNEIILVVSIIIIIILLDMIFNISSRITENFDGLPLSFLTVQSIRSKIDGKILKIEPNLQDQKNTGENVQSITVRIPVDNDGHYLDYNGNEIVFSSKNNYNWKLHKIDTADQYKNVISNSGSGYQVDKVDYPFYMLTLLNNDKIALQYSNGNLMCLSVGNYDSQKWDISTENIPTKQLVLKNIYDTPIGPLSKSSHSDDDNRIKLNLNFNNEKLKQLFNHDETNDTPQKCDTYLPKSAVKSLCPGCDY
jgi:hypothetical protein